MKLSECTKCAWAAFFMRIFNAKAMFFEKNMFFFRYKQREIVRDKKQL